jgi:Ca2+-binding RTX toxin-like protein
MHARQTRADPGLGTLRPLDGSIAVMLRSTVLALTAALVLCSGPASAVVRNGGPGDDKLKGTDQADTLRGKGGNDRLFGLGGDDLLVGGPGDDSVKGGPGLDDMGGGTGDDRLVAGFDDRPDRTYGGPGNDVIYISGADSTSGGSGDDKIIATYPDPKMDILCGGGDDEVIFNEPHPGVFLDSCEDVQVISAG